MAKRMLFGMMLAGYASIMSAHVQAQATRMVMLPSGTYQPLYSQAGQRVRVSAFRLDVAPVTNRDFARFASTHPEYRGAARIDDATADWPVTNVTLAAARAYCAAQGRRLPTVNEWEYAAAASETLRDASASAAFRQRLIELYTRPRATGDRPARGFRNVHGIADLHGVVWEWTEPEQHDHAHAPGHMYCASSAIGAARTNDFAAFLRYAFRSGLQPSSKLGNLGFRCAT